jgi:predicted outer membrane repeat protein
MPLLRDRRPRKRWRYVAVFEERVMLCCARVEVGPLPQSFWAVWDRRNQVRHAHTSFLRGRGEVRFDGNTVRLKGGGISADLRLDESNEIESVCPSGDSYAWTRKRAGMEVHGTVTIDATRVELDGARGVEDQSAGYHRRHTDWFWSAGVGEAGDGRAIAWNLVTGINDPPAGSERAVWLDGEPSEPGPVAFDGLNGIRFSGGSRLEFAAESERARDDNLLLLRSRYRHVFGTFTGFLDGVELARGLGVMEEHSALW